MRTRSVPVCAGALAALLAWALSGSPAGAVAPRAGPGTLHEFHFRLTGGAVVPPVNTDGFGSCTVTLDDATGAYTVTGDFGCLRGQVGDVHFHGPAPVGQEAPIIAGFAETGGSSGTFSDTGTLDPQQVQDMLGGLVYVQLHSTFALQGELRGQVVPCPPAGSTIRNGSGSNPVLLTSSTTPVLNSPWSADLDCTGYAPSFAFLFFYARPWSGTFIEPGEILVRNAGKRLLRVSMPHAGDVVSFQAQVPDDLGLCGLAAYGQAVIFGSPGPQLTNALDLVFGL